MIWTLCNEMNALYESTTEEGTARTTSEQIQLQPGQLPRQRQHPSHVIRGLTQLDQALPKKKERGMDKDCDVMRKRGETILLGLTLFLQAGWVKDPNKQWILTGKKAIAESHPNSLQSHLWIYHFFQNLPDDS